MCLNKVNSFISDFHTIFSCPECKSSLNLNNNRCLNCSYKFNFIDNNFFNLLPSKIEINKINENDKWENEDFIENKNNPAFFSLVAKGNDIFYFYEKILPNYKFYGNVLEIGSGSCWMSSLVKLYNPDITIIASDVSLNALLRGKEVEKIIGGKIDFLVCADIESLPFKDETFDVVFGASIIHHLLNPQKGVNEIFRVLKKGGYYLSILELEANILLAYLWSRIGTAGEVAGKWKIKENVYSFRQYRNYFYKAGFKKIKFFLERDIKYKNHHWLLAPYYKLMSFFPDSFVKIIGSSIGFVSYK